MSWLQKEAAGPGTPVTATRANIGGVACPECPEDAASRNRPWAKVWRDERVHGFFDGNRYWTECGTAHRYEVWGTDNEELDSPPPPPPPSVHGPLGFDAHVIDANPREAYMQVEVKRWVPDFPCARARAAAGPGRRAHAHRESHRACTHALCHTQQS